MKRAVRSLIRIIAAALVVFGGLGASLEFARHRVQGEEMRLGPLIQGAVLIVVGIAIFAASARLAEKFADDFGG